MDAVCCSGCRPTGSERPRTVARGAPFRGRSLRESPSGKGGFRGTAAIGVRNRQPRLAGRQEGRKRGCVTRRGVKAQETARGRHLN